MDTIASATAFGLCLRVVSYSQTDGIGLRVLETIQLGSGAFCFIPGAEGKNCTLIMRSERAESG